MPGMGTEIFVVTIRENETGDLSVYAEGAEDEAISISFTTTPKFDSDLTKLHDRGGFGFATAHDHQTGCSLVGEHLFNTFFVDRVLARYRDYRQRNNSDPRIGLQIPQSLYYLPWEVIRDPTDLHGQFLSMQGSVVRYESESPSVNKLYADAPESYTHLFLLANIDENPIGPYEPIDSDLIKFLKVDPASYSRFGERLTKTHPQPFGLVFFGHGTINEDQGYLIFVTQTYKPFRRLFNSDPKAGIAVGTAIGAVKKMRIAYVFACESAWAAKKSRFSDSITGSILQLTNLGFVVGAQTPIDFFAARDFFVRTMEALTDNYPLDLALTEGRKTVYAMTPQGTTRNSWRDWWVPVLYARTTNFDILPKVESLSISFSKSVLPPGPPERPNYFSALRQSAARLFSSDNDAMRDIL